jgi:adenylate cyclase
MAEERARRRLATILAADVVGYSRLMEQDEAGTLVALKSRRKDVLEPLVAKHQGRVFKVTGDCVLVEFASAVNAVQCALDLQQGMAEANAKQPDDRHIVLRIGVNLGDVMVEGSDLYGDGVNIAARLESLADPGGILVSGTAYDHVGTKIRVAFDDLGAQTLKNIAQPVRAYRVSGVPVAVASPKSMSDKPSIVVLPFANLSGDPEQQYFSDGITEDIITELSRYRSLQVIARYSSFAFRGPSIDIQKVCRQLGARYVVEGSVRRVGSQLRITAQLIEAASESHLWAERYDRDMRDVFAIQDEVTRTIAVTLEGRVAASGAEQAKRKPTTDWRAYDCILQGLEREDRFDHVNADLFYVRATELDPGYARAHAHRAVTQTVLYWLYQKPEQLREAQASAERALSLDEHDPMCHEAMAYLCMHRRQFDQAGQHYDRAVALNPNEFPIVVDHANWLVRTGRPAEALQVLDAAMRLEPFPATWVWDIRFNALFHLKRYDDAIVAIRNLTTFHHWHHAYLAAALAHSGRIDEAQGEVAALLAAKPDASLALFAEAEPYLHQASLDHVLNALRKAGLPE